MRRIATGLAVATAFATTLPAVLSAVLPLVLPEPAVAQEKAAPPPAWKQGMPDSMAESKLAPHAGKLTATPAE